MHSNPSALSQAISDAGLIVCHVDIVIDHHYSHSLAQSINHVIFLEHITL